MSVKLDGRALAKSINERTAQKIINYRYYEHAVAKSKQGFQPTLVTVLVGDDPASQMYIRMKQRKAKQLGMTAYNITLSKNVSQSLLDQTLDNLSANADLDGILLQLPLPKGLDSHEASKHIKPSKDVDGVNPVNIGKLASGVDVDKEYYPIACTPRGIMTLFCKGKKWETLGMEATVVGRSDIVGRPLAFLLINAGAEVKVLNSHTYQDKMDATLHRSDLIVSATGQGNLVTSDQISPRAILIDAGIDHDPNGKLIGDITPEAKKKALAYTPVPGGVGPMTIAMLMRQTYELAVQHADKDK